LIEKVTADKELKDRRVQSGVSLSSGLIAGGSIIGLIGIILHVTSVLNDKAPTGFAGSNEMGLLLLVILVISIILPLLNIKKEAK